MDQQWSAVRAAARLPGWRAAPAQEHAGGVRRGRSGGGGALREKNTPGANEDKAVGSLFVAGAVPPDDMLQMIGLSRERSTHITNSAVGRRLPQN